MKRIGVLLVLLLTALPAIAQAQGDLTIQIVKPGDRRNVEIGKIPLTVAISSGALPANYTWQVWIDSVPQGMVTSGLTTEIDMPEPTGPHRLRAELYDPAGTKVSAHEIIVMAAPIEIHEPLFNRDWYVPAMALMTLVIIGLIILGLRLRPRTAT